MTKRAKRYRNPNLPQEAFNNPIAAASSPATSAAGGAASGSATAASRRMNWQEEYSEVLGDLRRTAVIAVALIAVMIVLSFVIR